MLLMRTDDVFGFSIKHKTKASARAHTHTFYSSMTVVWQKNTLVCPMCYFCTPGITFSLAGIVLICFVAVCNINGTLFVCHHLWVCGWEHTNGLKWSARNVLYLIYSYRAQLPLLFTSLFQIMERTILLDSNRIQMIITRTHTVHKYASTFDTTSICFCSDSLYANRTGKIHQKFAKYDKLVGRKREWERESTILAINDSGI